MYKAEDILKDDLTKKDILKYSKYLEEMTFFEDITSNDEDDVLTNTLDDLVTKFVVNNKYDIINILNEYEIMISD